MSEIQVFFPSAGEKAKNEIYWFMFNTVKFLISNKDSAHGFSFISKCATLILTGRAANLSLSKKVLLSLKNHILRWKKVFLRAERASWARSAHHEREEQSSFGRGPGPA